MSRKVTAQELVDDVHAVLREVAFTREPVFIEQAGCAMAVVVDVDTYLTQMQALEGFKRMYDPDGAKGRPQQGVLEAASPEQRAVWEQ